MPPLFTRTFVLAGLSSLAQGLSFTLFLHLPAVLQELGANEAEIGVIFGITAAASILIRPLVGGEMDRHGRRRSILAGNGLNVASIALYLTVTTLGPWIYVVRVLHGLGEALVFTALFTLAADVVPEGRRTEGLALFGVSGMLPIGLGGVIGDFVLQRADFSALFQVALAFAVVALVLALPLRDPAELSAAREPSSRFREALTDRRLLPIWWMTTVFSIALAGYFTFMKTFVAEIGAGSVGLFFGAYAATAIALRLTVGWLPDRLGPTRVLFPALGFLAVGLAVLAAAGSAPAIGLAGVLCGTGHAFAFPILYGITVTRTPAARRGSALAIYTALFDVGILVGGPLLGLLIEGSGYRTMFAVSALSLMAGAVVFAGWDRRAGHPAPVGAER